MAFVDLITREDLDKFKLELFAELKKLGKVATPDESAKKWLKSSEARKLLKVSHGTLQSLRIKGILKYSQVGSTYYYKHEDILKVLEQNQKGGWANEK